MRISRSVIVVAIGISGVVASCTQQSDRLVASDSKHDDEQQLLIGLDVPPNLDIIAIAKRAAADYGKLRDDELKVTQVKKLDGEMWEVMVWRIPELPGGHYFVVIGKDGRVTRIEPGA